MIKTGAFLLLFFAAVQLAAQSFDVVPQLSHSRPITHLSQSPDGSFFITCSQDNTFKVWETATGRVFRDYFGHSDAVSSAAFSADGKYIISSSHDKSVKIWEFVKNPDNKILDFQYKYMEANIKNFSVMNGDGTQDINEQNISKNFGCLNTYRHGKSGYKKAFFIGGIKRFVSLGYDNQIKIWDPLKTAPLQIIDSKETVQDIVVSQDEKMVAVVSESMLRLWDASFKKQIAELPLASGIQALAFSAGKKHLAYLTHNEVHWIELSKPSLVHKISLTVEGTGLSFVDDDKHLLVAGRQGHELFAFSEGKSVKKTDPYFHAARSVITAEHIVSLDTNNSVQLYDFANKAEVYRHDFFNKPPDVILLSPTGRYIASASRHSVGLIDLYTGKTTFLQNTDHVFRSMQFSNDEAYLAVLYSNGMANVHETSALQKISSTTVHNAIDLVFKNKNTIKLLFENGYKEWETESGNLSALTPAKGGKALRFLDANHALLNTDDGYTVCENGKLSPVAQLGTGIEPVIGLAQNGKYLAYRSGTGELIVYNIDAQTKKAILTGKKEKFHSLAMSADGALVAILYEDGKLRVFDAIKGAEFPVKFSSKQLASLLPISFTGHNALLYVNASNQFIIRDLKSEKEVKVLVGAQGALVLAADHSYLAGNRGQGLMAFRKDNVLYNFEQFDLHYNRPDKVMAALGQEGSELQKLYKSAYDKRLKKMGVKNSVGTFLVAAPQLEILEKEKLPAYTKEASVKINIRLNPTTIPLKALHVLANGVPIYGKEGMPLTEKMKSSNRAETEIELVEGNNLITCYVTNERQVESLRKTVRIVCESGRKPDLYLLAIGASKYANAAFNLNYAAKDARDLCTMYESSDLYANKTVVKLLDADVSTAAIETFKKTIALAKANDHVILFYAGHGVVDANLDYFLSTYDINFGNPAQNGLSFEQLSAVLDNTPCRNKWILMDACHAGEIDKEEVAASRVVQKGPVKFTARSIPGNDLVSKNAVNISDLSKAVFSDIRKHTGIIVISSSGGQEYALEGDEWNNGVFTYSLINGLKKREADLDKDGQIHLSELQNYLQSTVYRLTQGRQKPTSRVENIHNDFRVW